MQTIQYYGHYYRSVLRGIMDHREGLVDVMIAVNEKDGAPRPRLRRCSSAAQVFGPDGVI